MNKDLEQFSEERLKEIIELSKFTGGEETLALARIALSVKQAKPVAWFVGDATLYNSDTVKAYVKRSGLPVSPLYTTPQPAHTEQVIPDGWKLVPIELTPEMRDAWDSAPNSEDDDVNMSNAYRAMLAAAPKPETE